MRTHGSETVPWRAQALAQRAWLAAALVGLCMFLAPVPARAQGDVKQARETFSRAEVQYRLRNFREALALYQEALKLANRPSIIFNIAQCHRQLEEHERALFYYRLYLTDWARATPDRSPPNKKEVDRRIDELNALVEAQKKAEEEARLRAEQEAKLRAEQEAKLKAEQDARLRAEQEAKLKAGQEAPAQPGQEPPGGAAEGSKEGAEAQEVEKKPALPGKGQVELVGLRIPAAVVMMAGVVRARAPVERPIAAYAGTYPLRIEAEGFRPWEETIVVKAGETTTVLISMKRIPTPKTYLLGLSIAALVFTAGCEGMAWYFQGEIDDGGDNGTNNAMMIAGHVMAGVFGATAIGTLAGYLLSFKIDDDPQPQKSVSLVPTLGGIMAVGRF